MAVFAERSRRGSCGSYSHCWILFRCETCGRIGIWAVAERSHSVVKEQRGVAVVHATPAGVPKLFLRVPGVHTPGWPMTPCGLSARAGCLRCGCFCGTGRFGCQGSAGRCRGLCHPCRGSQSLEWLSREFTLAAGLLRPPGSRRGPDVFVTAVFAERSRLVVKDQRRIGLYLIAGYWRAIVGHSSLLPLVEGTGCLRDASRILPASWLSHTRLSIFSRRFRTNLFWGREVDATQGTGIERLARIPGN